MQLPSHRAVDGLQGRFEPLAKSPHCPACTGRIESPRLADAVYCLALEEEEDRARQAADHFHAIGLCRQVMFFRPRRGGNIEAHIWASHREMARHALAHNHNTALILEDDAHFHADWRTVSSRAMRAMKKLPANWYGFFLGHWPMQSYFVAPDVLRTRSACCHAYVASPRLLDWLARSRPLDPTLPSTWPVFTVDTTMANLPEMYALFPMAAVQRPPAVYRYNRHFTDEGTRRGWFDFTRHRYWVIHHCMRPAEAGVALASPLHWVSMRVRGIGAGQTGRIETRFNRTAKQVRQSGLFDEAYYAASHSDVARELFDPLWHYLVYGDYEGRQPHPLFDNVYYRKALTPPLKPSDNAVVHYLTAGSKARANPHPGFDTAWYLAQLPNGSTQNKAPLVHYLQASPSERRNPHLCFDEAWYLAQNPDVAEAGGAGLAHYLGRGWKEGRWPHALFDPARYLNENPDVAAAGVDPFDHYVRHGRTEGRAPWFQP